MSEYQVNRILQLEAENKQLQANFKWATQERGRLSTENTELKRKNEELKLAIETNQALLRDVY